MHLADAEVRDTLVGELPAAVGAQELQTGRHRPPSRLSAGKAERGVDEPAHERLEQRYRHTGLIVSLHRA